MPLSGPHAHEAPLVRPTQLFKDIEALPQSLLVFSPSDLRVILSRFDVVPGKTRDLRFTALHTVRVDKKEFTLAGPAIGAPLAVMLLEILVAFGSRQIIALGSCGSLQDQIRIGDLVLPGGAFSDEGTSCHYPVKGKKINASPRIFQGLKDLCQAQRQKLTIGNVWTTDAPFRETPQKVKKFQQRQAIAVEMELSALFKAATFYGVEVGALLVASDELFGLRWHSGYGQALYRKAFSKATEIALQLIKQLE